MAYGLKASSCHPLREPKLEGYTRKWGTTRTDTLLTFFRIIARRGGNNNGGCGTVMRRAKVCFVLFCFIFSIETFLKVQRNKYWQQRIPSLFSNFQI